jgi:hypothetical protein
LFSLGLRLGLRPGLGLGLGVGHGLGVQDGLSHRGLGLFQHGAGCRRSQLLQGGRSLGRRQFFQGGHGLVRLLLVQSFLGWGRLGLLLVRVHRLLGLLSLRLPLHRGLPWGRLRPGLGGGFLALLLFLGSVIDDDGFGTHFQEAGVPIAAAVGSASAASYDENEE